MKFDAQLKRIEPPSCLASNADKQEAETRTFTAQEGRKPKSVDTEGPKSKKTSKPKPQKSKAPERLKCSLLLTKENDLRLTVLASLKGTDRSALVNTILDEALRGVVVSLRGALATEGGAGGAAQESETEAA